MVKGLVTVSVGPPQLQRATLEEEEEGRKTLRHTQRYDGVVAVTTHS